MEFFGEFDIANAADDPFDFDEGIYEGTVIEKVKALDGTKKRENDEGDTVDIPYAGLSVTFKTPENGPYNHYFSYPTKGDSEYVLKLKRAALKNLLSGAGIPQSKMNEAEPADIVGAEVTIILKKGKKGFMNIDVRRNKDVGGAHRDNSDEDMSFKPSRPAGSFDDDFGL